MKKKFDICYDFFDDGIVQVSYIDYLNKLDYNTTVLRINPVSNFIDGHTLYNCVVAWNLDNSNNPFYNIVVEFDKELLLNDEAYCSYFMSKLLNKERVVKYLNNGLSNNPDFQCGIYVGGVSYNESGSLDRIFYKEIGRKFHNEDYMVLLRNSLGKKK